MGDRDSSKTRVQPVFTQLLSSPTAGWLPALLSMGSRASKVSPHGFDWVGDLRKSPKRKMFEYSAVAPIDYLETLLACTSRLDAAARKNPAILKTSTNPMIEAQRQKLIAGDASVVALGQSMLRNGRSSKRDGTWWVLEGPTMVDCALFAENASIFIEGKRTEPNLTDKVSWDLQRNQVFRNLDALRFSHDRGTDFFALLIIEDDSVVKGKGLRKQADALDAGWCMAVPSWPHLSDVQAKWLYEKHYLGYTTWQEIASQFAITLYDKVEDQPAHTVNKELSE